MAHGIPWYLRGRVVIGVPAALASAYWLTSSLSKKKDVGYVVAPAKSDLSNTALAKAAKPSTVTGTSPTVISVPVPNPTPTPAQTSSPPLVITPPAHLTPSSAFLPASTPSVPSSASSPSVLAAHPPSLAPTPLFPTVPASSHAAAAAADVKSHRVAAQTARVVDVSPVPSHTQPTRSEPLRSSLSVTPAPATSRVPAAPLASHAPAQTKPVPSQPFGDSNPLFSGLQLRLDWLAPSSEQK